MTGLDGASSDPPPSGTASASKNKAVANSFPRMARASPPGCQLSEGSSTCLNSGRGCPGVTGLTLRVLRSSVITPSRTTPPITTDASDPRVGMSGDTLFWRKGPSL